MFLTTMILRSSVLHQYQRMTGRHGWTYTLPIDKSRSATDECDKVHLTLTK